MLAIIQRVTQAQVTTTDSSHQARVGPGYLVLLGVAQNDTKKDALKLAQKISKLRLMPDQEQKMNLSLADANAELLVVSQFTLLGDSRKGNRPSFIKAASPKRAQSLYQLFVTACRQQGLPTQTGVFGHYMKVKLTNDGPVTLILDSQKL